VPARRSPTNRSTSEIAAEYYWRLVGKLRGLGVPSLTFDALHGNGFQLQGSAIRISSSIPEIRQGG
jgi:hypothetical protein